MGLIEPKAKKKPKVEVEAEEDKVVEEALAKLDPAELEKLGLSRDDLIPEKDTSERKQEGMGL